MCPYMALNTLQKLYLALRDLKPEITVPEDVRVRAKVSLDRMLEMAAAVSDVPIRGD
jgi:quinolinate synthase